jgi:hypothetical protein
MANMATGGAALAIGIWYQTLGAAAALTSEWDFRGVAPNIYGEATGLYNPEPLKILLEYFDMDLVITDYSGKWFVQFKVSGQRKPTPFGRDEAREVLRNATHAMLRHTASTTEPIAGFIVASNRPPGKFDLIARIAESCRVMGAPDPFLAFATSTAPDELFPEASNLKSSGRKKKSATKVKNSKARTMRDLARSITVRKASEWRVSVEESTNACLKAMWNLRFAEAHPTKLLESVNRWLSTWGILPDEYESYTTSILGALQNASVNGTELSEMAIMRYVYGSSSAVPLIPKYIWQPVINDLVNHRLPDPPTPQLIKAHGMDDWIFDRSELLQGLPYSFAELVPVALADVDSPNVRPSNHPRIFALVGDGGVGKTVLLRTLFEQIAGSVWDWQSSTLITNGRFLGCPIIREPEPTAIDGLPAILMNWGGRRQALTDPVDRIAHANGVSELEAAVWFGLDGLDEISDEDLRSLARRVANYAHRHPKIRIVLTCRTDHFRRIEPYLNADGLLRRLQIDEFTRDQSIKALFEATDRNLRLERQNVERMKPNPLGTRTGLPTLAFEPGPFDDSIRQPLFIGVLRRLYVAGELDIIQNAYYGDLDSFKHLASEYLYDSCERIERRIDRRYVTASRIFQSIRQLSLDAKTSSLATPYIWMNICNVHLGGLVQWGELFSMCLSSGLIKDVGSGAFEWRHPLVGEYLSTINERAGW